MFEKFKAKRDAANVPRAVTTASSGREAQRALLGHQIEGLSALLSLATGATSASDSPLMLKPGERALLVLAGTGLVEDKRGAGHWQGQSQGVSFPIGSIKGRSVRYHVGASKGHFVPGDVTPTVTDHGTMTLTNQRIVFQGSSKSIEAPFVKMLGVEHSPGAITISVSNREKSTTLYFGAGNDDLVTDHLNVAVGLYHGEQETLVAGINEQLGELHSQLAALDTPPS